MTKFVSLSVALLLVCGAFLAAQENAQDSVKERPADASPIDFSAYGKAVWAPVAYRGRGDSTTNREGLNEDAGIGVGAGPRQGGSIGAEVGFEVRGHDPSERIGFDLRMRVQPGKEGTTGGNTPVAYGNDNMAYLWTRPFGEVLKMQMGMYQWDDLRGKIGGVGEVAGNYGGDEDAIFQRVESDTFGALIILQPPPTAPDGIRGITLFGSFGVTGGLDFNSGDSFAANAKDGAKYVFSTPHAGIAYGHEKFGLARFQFIGSNYVWGKGDDWNTRTVEYPWYGSSTTTHWWFPARVRDAAQLELAVNLTRIQGLNLDIGFNYPLQVTVIKDDEGSTQRTKVGPTYSSLGVRQPGTYSFMQTRLAETEGDVWQPPIRIALGADYKLADFGLRFRAKLEFGEEVAFADRRDNYKGGVRFEGGLEPSYAISGIGTVSLAASILFKANDEYNGKKNDASVVNIIEMNSIQHNSRTDLGLGAFFARNFGHWGHIKVGFCINLPLGGDRYEWSTDAIPDAAGTYFNGKNTEAYKKLNMVFAVPIILEMDL